MKRLIFGMLIASLLVLAACSQQYRDYTDESFSARYPDWPAGGNGLVAVQKSGCQVSINIEDDSFDPAQLETAIDTSVVPALQDLGLAVDSKVAGNVALLKLSGPSAVAEAKYVACSGKLYKVSAGCAKNNKIISEVMNSVSCAA